MRPHKKNGKRSLRIEAYQTGLTPEEIGIVHKVLAETKEKLRVQLGIFVFPDNGIPKLRKEVGV